MILLRNMLHGLGLTGAAGIGMLLICAAFYFGAVKPAESDIAARRDAAQRMKSRAPYQPVSLDRRADDVQRFYSLFPPTAAITDEMEKLWTIATEYQVNLQQGEYRLESAGPGLSRYRVTLPVRASYVQLRQFINYILTERPAISIDGLRLERKKIGETQLDAQIRLTLYFRPASAAAANP